ncbi:MAG: MBL fold metallo-hydrolase [Acidimicrobiia bacterium]|nr:MBL fold metallo-hydrolase [Acidimicrobiia bacterium]
MALFDPETPGTVDLRPVDRLTITILVDNITDLLLQGGGPIVRASLAGGPQVDVRVFEGPGPDVVRAEHGYSAMVTVHRGDTDHRVLFDAGISPDGMVENMRRLDIDPADLEAVVMSHGHLDHVGGLAGLLDRVGRVDAPLVLHPDFWLHRRINLPGRTPVELPVPSRRALEDGGFTIVEEEQPSFVLDGDLLVTGEIHRSTPFEQGFPVHEARRDGEWLPDPLIRDDQAIVVHLRDRGLVVLTGCGHAGIVNIVRHARHLTGIDDVHAVVGGFHLSGPLFEPIIDQTVDHLAAAEPDLVVPGHCTGWRARHALATRMPEAYVHPVVGTRVVLGS